MRDGFATSISSVINPTPQPYLGGGGDVVVEVGGSLVFVDGFGVVVIGGVGGGGWGGGVVDVVSLLKMPPVSVESGGVIGGSVVAVVAAPSVDIGAAVSRLIGKPNVSTVGAAICGAWIGQRFVGCVPSLKAVVTTRFAGQFGDARPPLVSSIAANEIPGGVPKSTFGCPGTVASM